MIGEAASRGAATLVNAIACGKGAAVGITLEMDVRVDLEEGRGAIAVNGTDEGRDLVVACVQAVAARANMDRVKGEVAVRSDIPISRGLKSSSAVTNATTLAAARALDVPLTDEELLDIAIDESIKAGVTVTGAFDDAAACFHGGVAVTDNFERRILKTGSVEGDPEVVIHVPKRRIQKHQVTREMFADHIPQFEEAVALALRGEYASAMALNSRLCSEILDVPNDAAEAAIAAGAMAAGITGTGPATVILCRTILVDGIVDAIDDGEAEILRARLNHTRSREVVPRLL